MTCGLPIGSYFCFEITKSQETGLQRQELMSVPQKYPSNSCAKNSAVLFLLLSPM